MVKKIILAAGLLFSVLSGADGEFVKINELKYGANQIAVGTISVTYDEKIKLEPDIAEFSLIYLTEGATPNTASNQNIKNMTALKEYLKTLGVGKSDITTLDYKNFERDEKSYKEAPQFEARLSIIFDMQTDGFYKIVKLLEQHGISNLEQYDDQYFFTITRTASSENAAKADVQNIYEKIEKPLKNSGVVDNVGIKKYEVEKVDKQLTIETKKYFSQNQIKIKTTNFENIGKIYAKAQELKMNVNNDLVYFVSDEKRQKALADYEGGLFEKLQKKAQRLIGDKEYSLGAVSNISVTSLASDNSRYSYRSYNQEYLTNSANSITQTQAAQDVDINPPSAHEITIKISAGFDIVSGVKR